MYIERDLTQHLIKSPLPVQLLIGPRQCGKSTLLTHLTSPPFTEINFDDWQWRQLATRDPTLFLAQCQPPLVLDEVQYVPMLFPEIKRYIDQRKKERLAKGSATIPVLFRMTGSNQLLMDKNIKESLAGRASYFDLNTLTVHEIIRAQAATDPSALLFRGGWPELYIDTTLSPVQYLNDYIRSYIEKDIILSAGVQKQMAFNIVLGLLAARTGMLLDYANIAKDSGVQAVTVKEWVSLLQRTGLVHCLPPYTSNLNKRLTKSPKFYFLDTGLATRLQGWQDLMPLINSPQAGPLFETLVFAEIFKFIKNHGKDWQLFMWRTKENEEIDFLITTPEGRIIALDAKMSLYTTQPTALPPSFRKMFPSVAEIIIVTLGGKKIRLASNCLSIPIIELCSYLQEI